MTKNKRLSAYKIICSYKHELLELIKEREFIFNKYANNEMIKSKRESLINESNKYRELGKQARELADAKRLEVKAKDTFLYEEAYLKSGVVSSALESVNSNQSLISKISELKEISSKPTEYYTKATQLRLQADKLITTNPNFAQEVAPIDEQLRLTIDDISLESNLNYSEIFDCITLNDKDDSNVKINVYSEFQELGLDWKDYRDFFSLSEFRHILIELIDTQNALLNR